MLRTAVKRALMGSEVRRRFPFLLEFEVGQRSGFTAGWTAFVRRWVG
jgi:hypothetical protein